MCYPDKNEAFTQCWVDVGPASQSKVSIGLHTDCFGCHCQAIEESRKYRKICKGKRKLNLWVLDKRDMYFTMSKDLLLYLERTISALHTTSTNVISRCLSYSEPVMLFEVIFLIAWDVDLTFSRRSEMLEHGMHRMNITGLRLPSKHKTFV